jgi:hypothetical protein
VDGLLPLVPDNEATPESAAALSTDYESFTNYSGVENDSEVVDLIVGTHLAPGLVGFRAWLPTAAERISG